MARPRSGDSRDLSLGFRQNGRSYQYFMQAALVDLEDVRGNAADGIHGASAGGVWQAVVLGFGGFQLTQKAQWRIHICPNWTRLKYKIHWRGDWHEFDLRPCPDIRGVIFDLDGV